MLCSCIVVLSLFLTLIAKATDRPVLIIDFDDTIFPTSDWMKKRRLGKNGITSKVLRENWDIEITNFLLYVSSRSIPVIVTSSCPKIDWVKKAAEKYASKEYADIISQIPRFYSRATGSLSKQEIFQRILSAAGGLVDTFLADERGSYEFLFPTNPESQRVVISMSDQIRDADYFLQQCQSFPNLLCRAIKVIERPSPRRMIDQTKLFRSIFPLVRSNRKPYKYVTVTFSDFDPNLPLKLRIRYQPGNLNDFAYSPIEQIELNQRSIVQSVKDFFLAVLNRFFVIPYKAVVDIIVRSIGRVNAVNSP